ncbi:hypothetical protein BO83DRAFT_203042 [Aspergillus eucalypticola CBS 122712]|uniref:Uncharacterized protein n=1 Tax=Aspergillus eucalypticola (strain CBS 122712 / IBT 29274) TaxID=1448314 RepID=A0A317W0Q8_ASPEC|nr:uncharacterized protein BO83DRAFT_203042 [Aspergillus eucalypticola CBS 122712]PWY80073.1 hypothetical protein BO83DRAFT_203042 [Aspergillus eucalypticola CBS 122712]
MKVHVMLTHHQHHSPMRKIHTHTHTHTHRGTWGEETGKESHTYNEIHIRESYGLAESSNHIRALLQYMLSQIRVTVTMWWWFRGNDAE